jgi:pilus assembly protein CpaF
MSFPDETRPPRGWPPDPRLKTSDEKTSAVQRADSSYSDSTAALRTEPEGAGVTGVESASTPDTPGDTGANASSQDSSDSLEAPIDELGDLFDDFDQEPAGTPAAAKSDQTVLGQPEQGQPDLGPKQPRWRPVGEEIAAAPPTPTLAAPLSGIPPVSTPPVPAPAVSGPQPRPQLDDWDPVLTARWSRATAVFSEVDTVLSIISRDPQLTRELTTMVVTRDPDLDNAQKAEFRRLLSSTLATSGRGVLANPRDIDAVYDFAYDEVIGLGPLGMLWRDDAVTEILVDGPDAVYAERDGRILATPLRFRDLEHAQRLARTLSEKVSQRKVSPANPLVTAELPGARVAICYGAGVVRSGISITIRKFRPLMGMAQLLAVGALNEEMVAFLRDIVTARATIVVSGGTCTGKTTMVNALSESIPDEERIVTIEDAFELQLANRHTVSLQTKESASGDDTVSVSQADLLVQSLRMRPDRIVVGEIREPHGAQVFIQAANTGHDGSLTTIHANTPHAAINFRLTGLLRTATGMSDDVAVREVATAVDVVVQITRRAGRRFVSEIALVDPTRVEGNAVAILPLYQAKEEEGRLEFVRISGVGADTVLAHKLVEAGLDPRRWGNPS